MRLRPVSYILLLSGQLTSTQLILHYARKWQFGCCPNTVHIYWESRRALTCVKCRNAMFNDKYSQIVTKIPWKIYIYIYGRNDKISCLMFELYCSYTLQEIGSKTMEIRFFGPGYELAYTHSDPSASCSKPPSVNTCKTRCAGIIVSCLTS